MGSKNGDRDARPPHEVSLSGFWIYSHPVTVAQYRRFCQASEGTSWEHRMPPPPKWGWQEDHPMVQVSWEDARDYSRWAFGSETGVFLPTEAQFERAAQGAEATEYPWGEPWNDSMCVNSVRPTRAVSTEPPGLRPPNSFGLYDMAGNVWEWCQDGYDANYYKRAPAQDPVETSDTGMRVVRGGACNRLVRSTITSSFLFHSGKECGII
jgi:formylglycine-generating enzyme